MPNIMPLEVVVVGAGFLVLCIFPVLVTWADARSRRRVQLHAPFMPSGEVLAPPKSAPAPGMPVLDVSPAAEPPPSSAVVPGSSLEGGAVAPVVTAGPDNPERAAEVPPPPVPESAPAAAQGEPDSGRTYEFRLQDLRRARLLDWPPAAIRDNPEQHRLWQEGMAVAAAHQTRIDTTILRAPYLPQSACLGRIETAAPGVRLHYFLFRDLWPVAANQAFAEALFEVDSTGAGLRSWVEPRR